MTNLTPYYALLNCIATPSFFSSLCRPLRVLTLNILLMEEKWSRSDCGQLGHWTETDDSHLRLSFLEAVQYLYFLTISGLKSAPPALFCRVQKRVYMMFDTVVNVDDKLTLWYSKPDSTNSIGMKDDSQDVNGLYTESFLLDYID